MKRIYALALSMMLVALTSSAQTNLFNGKHRDAPFGWTTGYVNKTWRTNFGGFISHENPWGEADKRLHGIQTGFTFQPCFHFGLGLHTGAYYECYFSYTDPVKKKGHDEFREHDIYVPLHLMYRIPFTRDFSLSLYGGVGMNWAIAGTYNDYFWGVGADPEGIYVEKYSVPVEFQRYGNGQWPHHFNLQWEMGASLRYKFIQASFTYSLGATNHDFYVGHKTRQDKISISLSFVCDLSGDRGL